MLKKVTTFQAVNASFCDWSPDGKHILTATLYKRLKVDNGLKLWHYSGALIHEVDEKEMYQVGWMPDDANKWPDRSGVSPWPKGIAKPGSTSIKPVGAYRPPGARDGTNVERGTLDSLSSKLRSSKSIPGLNPKKGSHSNRSTPSASKREEVVPVVVGVGKISDTEKKIKNLRKKLKQIEDIKKKMENGENVELTQIQKVESEAALLKELESLNLN